MVGFNVELITTLITIGTTLVVVLILRNYDKRRRKHGKLPPGGIEWPKLGSALSFFKPQSSTVLGHFLEEHFSKHGKIFTLRFIGWAVIISADPELNRFVVQNEAEFFENNVPSQIPALIGKYNPMFVVGEQHRQIKLFLANFFNSWDIRVSFLENVQKAADRILNGFKHENVIYVTQETQRFAFNIIAEKAIGMDVMDPEADQLLREFVTLRDGFHAAKINLPKTRHWIALKARENIIKIIKKRVEIKKMEHNENTKPRDLIGSILKNNLHESVENICSSVMGVITGGAFNISSAIDLAIYFLANCPKAVQQLREEYLQILRAKKDGDDKLTWHDYKNLKFSQYVFNETLRLGNVFPAVSKKAKKDVEFNGYLIPKGTPIVVCTLPMHLDPIVFEKPEEFNPWRWENIKDTNSYMPFGGGMHYCLGIEISKITTVIFVHHFLHRYDWELAEQDHPISLPIVVFPKKLPIKVYPLNGSI